ncbi:MAG: AAA family ATPase [bacterium]|nr:AAA family ATPase [bacterium]
MVKILSLKAKGFKQLDIDRLTFPEKGSILIIGKNESGKSTLFEAIFFALFGRGLVVGQGGNISLISYSSDELEVELGVALKDSYMTINRKCSRDGENHHYLNITCADGKKEVLENAIAVNSRIIQEIGLDSESLLNSCFVEQQNLDKIENISHQQREKAIAKLLNMDAFICLEEKLKEECNSLENDLKLIEKKKELMSILKKLPVITKEKEDLDNYLDFLSLQDEKEILVDRIKQEESEIKYLENDLRDLEKNLNIIDKINLEKKQQDLNSMGEMKNIITQIGKKEGSIKKLSYLTEFIEENTNGIVHKEKMIQELSMVKDELQDKEEAYREIREIKDALEKVLPLIERLLQEKLDLAERKKDIKDWSSKGKNIDLLQNRLKDLKNLKESFKEKYFIEGKILRKNKEKEIIEFKKNEEILLAELKSIRAKTDSFKEKDLLSLWEKISSSFDKKASITKEIHSKEQEIADINYAVEKLETDSKELNKRIYSYILIVVMSFIIVVINIGVIPWYLRIFSGVLGLLLLYRAYLDKKIIMAYSSEISEKLKSIRNIKENLSKLDGRKQDVSEQISDSEAKNELEDLMKKKGVSVPSSLEAGRNRIKEIENAFGGLKKDDIEEKVNQIKENLLEIESHIKHIEEDFVLDEFSGETTPEKIDNDLNIFMEKERAINAQIGELTKKSSFNNDDNVKIESEIVRVEKEIERQIEDSGRITAIESQLAEKNKLYLSHKTELEKMVIAHPVLKTFLPEKDLDLLDISENNEILANVKSKVISLQSTYMPGSLMDTSKNLALLESKIKDHKFLIEGYMKEAQEIVGENVQLDVDTLKKDIEFMKEEKNEYIKKLNTLSEKYKLGNDPEKIIEQMGYIMKEIEKDRSELESKKELNDLKLQKESRLKLEIINKDNSEKRLIFISEKLHGQNIDRTKKAEFLAKKEDLIGTIRFCTLKRDEIRSAGVSLTKKELDKGEDGLNKMRKTSEVMSKAREILVTTRKRIFEDVLPRCELNMARLIPYMTADRYMDVRIDPSDYRLEMFDDQANTYIPKKMFSGGTKDQISLALRLSFALATLPEELGAAPSFIFLDEPISAFDEERRDALVKLLITGELSDAFDQIFIISHFKELEEEFSNKIEMVDGKVKQ